MVVAAQELVTAATHTAAQGHTHAVTRGESMHAQWSRGRQRDEDSNAWHDLTFGVYERSVIWQHRQEQLLRLVNMH